MRISFSCGGKECESLEKTLKVHGLKSLFIKNLINSLKDENGEIPEERILAVLMNRFVISFDNAGRSHKEELKELDELSEIAKGFE